MIRMSVQVAHTDQSTADLSDAPFAFSPEC